MAASQQIVLITGANQGVGFETAKNLVLSSEKYHVLLGCRDLAKGLAAVESIKTSPIKGSITPIWIDVTNDTLVDDAAQHVLDTYGRLDVLVNNAGILSKNPSKRDAFREILEVNCVGALSVTEAFLPLLRKSSDARLIFVGSSTGSITQAADPTSKLYNPTGTEYRASKAAINMLVVQYCNLLGKEGIKVFGADPGLVVTNLMDADNQRMRGGVEGYVGGERIATVVKGERDQDVGRTCGVYGVSPW